MSDQLTQTITGLQSELKTWMGRNDARVNRLQEQLDALDLKKQLPSIGGGSSKTLGEMIVKGFLDGRDGFDRHGRTKFEVKSNPFLESKAVLTTGIVTPESMAQIGAARASYGAVRRALRTVPMTGASVFKIKETVNGWQASPQTEGSSKYESTTTLSAETISAKTIATWVEASKQATDDVEGLAEFLNSSLVWAVEKELEEQILFGNNVGENLNGMDTVATAFDSTILSASAGWQRADVLAAAGTQIEEAGFMPTHFVIGPRDFYSLSTEKDDEGRYILGSPRSQFSRSIWGLPIIVSPAMTAGQFIAFDAGQVVFRLRQDLTVDVSESHAENFVKNLLTWRCEMRGALVVMHAGAVVSGSLATSPA